MGNESLEQDRQSLAGGVIGGFFQQLERVSLPKMVFCSVLAPPLSPAPASVIHCSPYCKLCETSHNYLNCVQNHCPVWPPLHLQEQLLLITKSVLSLYGRINFLANCLVHEDLNKMASHHDVFFLGTRRSNLAHKLGTV